MKKTRNGDFYSYYKSIKTDILPIILRNYMYDAKVPYALYKMPNYVVDFLKYDKEFSIAYRSGKYIVVVFPDDRNYKNNPVLKSFYLELSNLMSEYRETFICIVRNEHSAPHYILESEREGYFDLRAYCKYFCLINPKNDSMFIFNRITDSEVKALGVLIQQYSFAAKK